MKKRSSIWKTPKARRGAWFVKVRGSYLPASWQGWLTYIPFIGFLIASYLLATNDTHTISSALLGVFPAWVAAAVVMTWLASQKS
jgi:hypothetical protein